MQKKVLLALMLALVMGLTGCALIEKDLEVDRATEIIRVGDTVIAKGTVQDQVQEQLNYMAYYYSIYGRNFDPTSKDAIKEAQTMVVDNLVEAEVKKQKAASLGLDSLSVEEEAALKEAVDTSWNSTLESIKAQYFTGTTLEENELAEAIDQKAEELGISRAAVEERERTSMVNAKLEEDAVKDVAVSEEDIAATHLLKVQEAKTNYETNLSAYGTAVNAGETVYYRPAGYRMTKQILVKFLPEDQAVMDDLNSAISQRNSTISTINQTLASMGITNGDELAAMFTVEMEQPPVLPKEPAQEAAATSETTESADGAMDEPVAHMEAAPKVTLLPVSTLATVSNLNNTLPADTEEEVAHQVQQLAIAQAELEFFAQQLENAKTNAFANIAARADDIIAQLNAGGDWDTLMAEYTEDPGMQGDRATARTGYAVCADFSGFDSAYTTAAMALEKVGDVSPKTEGMYGYYIIQYTSEVEEGEVPLADVRDAIHDELLRTAKDETWKDTVAQWVKDANAKIDWGALNN